MEKAQNIEVRRVKVHSPSQLPADYGTTPGGTLFGTTPGGTRIIYDRSFLLECRNSPLVKTSHLADLPRIPGVTCPLEKSSPPKSPRHKPGTHPAPSRQLAPNGEQRVNGPSGEKADDPQFDMDI